MKFLDKIGDEADNGRNVNQRISKQDYAKKRKLD